MSRCFPSTSEALNVLATSIDWKPGDRLEFPSNVLCWLRLKGMGVELRVARSDEGALRWESIAQREAHGGLPYCPSSGELQNGRSPLICKERLVKHGESAPSVTESMPRRH